MLVKSTESGIEINIFIQDFMPENRDFLLGTLTEDAFPIVITVGNEWLSRTRRAVYSESAYKTLLEIIREKSSKKNDV